MTGRCLTCKYWNVHGEPYELICEENDYEGEDMPHRKCLLVIHGNASATGSKMKSAPAAALDGSGYVASLWTKPEFGCTGFEERS